MKRIVTAAILIPLVLLAVFRMPLWLFLLIAAAVALADFQKRERRYGNVGLAV